MPVAALLRTHPSPPEGDTDRRIAAIEACLDCGPTCTACADACLAEDQVARLKECIRLDLDCALICAATAAVLTRRGAADALARAQVEACIAACRACAAECERHARMHEHCRICAETCRVCAEACAALAG